FLFLFLFFSYFFPFYFVSCNRINFHNSIGQGICNTYQAGEIFRLMQPLKGFSYTLTQYRSVHTELYSDLPHKFSHQ
ncbi:hypothetical protein PPACK8108_LOCUS9707, partial [Phakopsora pachyrhizi]